MLRETLSTSIEHTERETHISAGDPCKGFHHTFVIFEDSPSKQCWVSDFSFSLLVLFLDSNFGFQILTSSFMVAIRERRESEYFCDSLAPKPGMA